jgi:clan AA aspartic protease
VLIDTGFAGGLIVPEKMASGLTLNFEGVDQFMTATGQEFFAPAHTVVTNWFGQRLQMAIAISAEVKEALLGGQMLEGCRLTIDYAERTVIIEKAAAAERL